MEQKLSCFFCNARLGATPRNTYNIFKTIVYPLERKACDLIADVLDVELTEDTVHSDIVCRKCFKLVNEFADLESRAAEIRTDLSTNYNNTMRILMEQQEGVGGDEDYSPEADEEDQEEKEDGEDEEGGRGEMEDMEEEEMEEGVEKFSLDAEKLSQLVAENGNSALSDFILRVDEAGYDRPRLLVVNDGEFEEIDLVDVIGRKDSDLMAEVAELHGVTGEEYDGEIKIEDDGERFLKLVGNEHICRLCPLDEGSRPFSCETKNLSLMAVHLRHEHEVRIFLCDVCGAEFKKRNELNEHMNHHNVHEEGDFQCEVCNRIFNNLRLYRIHKRLHTVQSKAWSCNICDKKYCSKNLLEEHLNTHTGIRPYSCSTCSKTFASKYTFKAHMKTHETRERNFGCAQCGKTFLNSQNLQQHIKTHSEAKDYVCDSCGKGFGSMRNLEVHSVVHSGVKPYVCQTCGKAFARKAEIKDHERTHTGERPFQCEHCGARFSQRSNLQSHKRVTHYDDRRYICSECGKGFKRRRLLDYHVKAVHTGERPYECSTCGSTFVYPEHYKKHIRIHTGVKPYKCEVCEKAFNSRDNRNAHRFVHSDKKPYECLVCGAGFMRKPLLYTHMQQAGHVNDTIVVNQPRLDKEDVSLSLAEQDGDVEFTIVDENSMRSMTERQKLYLTDLNDHVIVHGHDNALFAKMDGGSLKTFTTEDGSEQLVDEDGNLVDLEGNLIHMEKFDDESITMTAHINEQGQLVNEDGQIISEDGQTLIVDESMNPEDGGEDIVIKTDPDSDQVQFVRVQMADGANGNPRTWLNVKSEDHL